MKVYEKALDRVDENQANQDYRDLLDLYLGKSYFQMKRYSESLSVTLRLLGVEDRHFKSKALPIVYRSHLQLGQIDEALALKELELFSSLPRSERNRMSLELGFGLHKQGEEDQAAKIIKNIFWKLKNPLLYSEYKEKMRKVGLFSEKLDTQDRLSLKEKIKFFSNNRDDQAISKIVDHYSSSSHLPKNQRYQFYQAIGYHYFKRRNYLEAQKYFQILLGYSSSAKQRAYVLYNLARISSRQGDKKRARELYLETIDTHPKGKLARRAQYEISIDDKNQGHYNRAIEGFLASPQTLSARWNTGWSTYLNRDYNQAISKFKEVKRRYGGRKIREKTQYWRARSLYELGRVKEAKKLFKKLINGSRVTFYQILSYKWLDKIEHKNPVEVKDSELIHFHPLYQASIYNEIYLPEMSKAVMLMEMNYDREADILLKSEFSVYKTDRDYWVPFAFLFSQVGNFRTPFRTVYNQAASEIYQGDMKKDPLAQIIYPQAFPEIVKKYAEKYNIDQSFIWSIMKIESTFRPRVGSPVGAIGLMQIMPATGLRMAKELEIKNWQAEQLKDPEMNIQLGVHYLNKLLDLFNNNYILVAAAYNAGEHRVVDWLDTWHKYDTDEFIESIPFTETRNYVKKMLVALHYYRMLYEPVHQDNMFSYVDIPKLLPPDLKMSQAAKIAALASH